MLSQRYGDCLLQDRFMDDSGDIPEKRQADDLTIPEPPHLCYTDSDGVTSCKVYTPDSERISVNVSLHTHELTPRGQFCHYDIIPDNRKNFSCRIPANLPGRIENKTCIVRCGVEQQGDGSLLAASPCPRIGGNEAVSFWTYLVVSKCQD
jgi:hypothetical protein